MLRKRIRTYKKIIVERDHTTRWLAWLAESPEIAINGKTPENAIRNLLGMFDGELAFSIEELSSINYAAANGHLEYWLRFSELQAPRRPALQS
jgi:predicted RNase H-like HicB family nuclease